MYTSPDLLARFCKVNLSNKKFGLIFYFGLPFRQRNPTFQLQCVNWPVYWDQEPLWLLTHRRWLLSFGCTYTAIKSMSDLFHAWTMLFANSFSLKSFSLSFKSHMNVFDLIYKFINGSFAFSPRLNLYIIWNVTQQCRLSYSSLGHLWCNRIKFNLFFINCCNSCHFETNWTARAYR